MSHVEVSNAGGISVEVFLTRPTSSFNIVAISGQDDVVAAGADQTLTFVAGLGMQIITDALTDTITFTSTAGSTDGGVVT